MSKATTFFIVALLLCFTLSSAARPEPTIPEDMPVKSHYKGAEAQVDESCAGGRDEECLMRRTLAAHLDYIYTQKQIP
ncbi:hypothetical protein RJ640_030600 [Escallonia rubra]|uniref:Phytosulfokine n=1 Tax=Escallonia rubra TaxID=112253 RepID=A0AA88UGJ2_9ASTE|nr:hypothetical protein RJ640_030600 [Escallonia rubra]